MKKRFLTAAAVGSIFLAACLVAPTEPGADALGDCAPGQSAFNGACRQECAATSDCAAGLSCMNVGGAATLCLDYDHCGYVGDDTECSARDGYGGYVGPEDPYGTSYSSYGPSDCVGNAKWQVEAPSTDPRCGLPHTVVRCQRRGARCELGAGTTLDVADP